jgi:hypothetical protein
MTFVLFSASLLLVLLRLFISHSSFACSGQLFVVLLFLARQPTVPIAFLVHLLPQSSLDSVAKAEVKKRNL